MNIENIKLDKIIPYKDNAKKHDKKQIQKVANSIKRFGWAQPLCIDKDNNLIIGHCRLEAAKLLGMIEAPCIRLENLTEKEVKALRLADNRLNESDWDMKLVIPELKGLDDELLDLTGFDKDLIIEPDEQDDVIPENVPVRSKLGDLYELGQHRVLCGDSTQQEAVLRLMNGKKADMVFTDPPYGMFLNADWSNAKSSLKFLKEKGVKGGAKHRNVIGDHEDFKPELIKTIFNSFDYCKEIFTWGADYYSDLLPDRNDGSWIVWDKRDGNENFDKMYGSCFELCFSKQKHKREIARIRWAGIFGHEQEGTTHRLHPTQKPILLGVWFFTKYCPEDGLIADLFLGSGSTLIACEKTNRICYGIEIDCKYTDVIIQRYVDFVDNPVIKCNGKIISWPKTKEVDRQK